MNDSCGNHCGGGDPTAAAKESVTALHQSNLWSSRYKVPKMDCPSEERMIRLALDGLASVQALQFDLPNRHVQVLHQGEAGPVTARLKPLGLGAELQGTEPAQPQATGATPVSSTDADAQEASTLRLLLAINGLMFFIEFGVGWWAQSAGLIADSLDMFADAAVYGLSLYAVGRTVSLKLRAAHLSGWFQMVLAFGVLAEVVRRFLFGSDPESPLMIGMAMVALVANVSCLWLISRNRESGAHMKASWIFSANDVLANLGVIVAGILVAWTSSPYPDLIIGTLIGLVVLSGARRILALKA
jgi:cation transport ATPase